MECPNCNRTYDDDFNFCPYCKTKKPSPKICPNCEFKTYDDFNFCPICSEDLISEREYQSRQEKIRIEEKKNQLRKIVENEDLTFSSKQILCDKINREEINDEIELEKEINKQIKKDRLLKKEELRKNELKKCVEYSSLFFKRKNELKKCVEYSSLFFKSKQKVYKKIKNSEITDVYELKEYLRKNYYYSICEEVDFIIEKGTLYEDFCTLINKNKIKCKNETAMSKEELLTILDSLRGKGGYTPAVFSKLTKLIKDGSITTKDKLMYEKLKLDNGHYEKDPNNNEFDYGTANNDSIYR